MWSVRKQLCPSDAIPLSKAEVQMWEAAGRHRTLPGSRPHRPCECERTGPGSSRPNSQCHPLAEQQSSPRTGGKSQLTICWSIQKYAHRRTGGHSVWICSVHANKEAQTMHRVRDKCYKILCQCKAQLGGRSWMEQSRHRAGSSQSKALGSIGDGEACGSADQPLAVAGVRGAGSLQAR